MPNMEGIYLGMCIRYNLDTNNIRMPLIINKVPSCNLSKLSTIALSKYDSEIGYNVIGSSGCKLLAKMRILSMSRIDLSTYIANYRIMPN